MSEEQKKRVGLPALYNVTPAQLKVVAGAVLTSGIADIAFHNPAILIGSLVFTGGAAWMSPEIVEMLVPGANRDAVVNAAHQAIAVVSPEPTIDPYKDQSPLAKLKRLAGMSTPPIYPTLAQPKDDAMRVVDVSEEEYLTPLPTPQLKQAKQQEEYDWYSDDEDDTALPTMSGLFTFSDVLAKGFIPTLKNIYVGSHPDGTPIYVEAKDLCHVALAGNTGGGKSSLMRMLMAQLCYAGATVLLLNPHYTPYDREHDEDWTPFIPFLKESPLACAEYKNIEYYIKALVEIVLPKRQARVRAGELPGKPYFVVIDELPAIAKKCKDVPGYIENLLREGRKYGIFLIVASQDFLVSTIGTEGGAVRQCFRTAFYVGGDVTTARTLLEKGVTIPETTLGKGTVMLRCSATKQPVVAKVPYLDNESLYRMLGPSTFDKRSSAPSSRVLPQSRQEEAEDDREVAQEANGSELDMIANLSTIRALREIGKRIKSGEDKAKIVKSFGLPYGRATQEMSAVVDLVEEQIRAEGK